MLAARRAREAVRARLCVARCCLLVDVRRGCFAGEATLIACTPRTLYSTAIQ